MKDDTGCKWLPAARLSELLATLPPDSRVMTNAVGNLLVLSADDTEMLAYVDFAGNGEIEPI